jgi:hypothetical protein
MTTNHRALQAGGATLVRAGSARHRELPVLGGTSVMIGMQESQAIRHSSRGPRPPKRRGSGFEFRLPRAGRPLPTKQASPGWSLTLRSSWFLRRQALRTSSSSAVPLPCHSQGSRPVLSGYLRTTPERRGPALFPAFTGDGAARSGFGSKGSLGPGLDRPCRDQPSANPYRMTASLRQGHRLSKEATRWAPPC